jgi:hypothetical protein
MYLRASKSICCACIKISLYPTAKLVHKYARIYASGIQALIKVFVYSQPQHPIHLFKKIMSQQVPFLVFSIYSLETRFAGKLLCYFIF